MNEQDAIALHDANHELEYEWIGEYDPDGKSLDEALDEIAADLKELLEALKEPETWGRIVWRDLSGERWQRTGKG